MPRKRDYSDYGDLRRASVEIFEDVLFFGESKHWAGDVDDRIEVERILRPFGIIYTDRIWTLQQSGAEPTEGPRDMRARLTGI